jgi:hypothetical protein
MILPPSTTKRRNETSELTRPIEAALNRLPGVRVARNNTGMLRDVNGTPVRYGLGIGSADIVGIVTRQLFTLEAGPGAADAVMCQVGQVFALEVKRPGQRPSSDQLRWLGQVISLGGFACVVHSIEEALDAVERCRTGEHE